MVSGFNYHRFLLDASDCGTGKTWVALATVLETGSRPLVVCKKAGVTHWKRVWAEHFGQTEELHVVNYEKLRTGKTRYGRWVTETKGKRQVEVFRFNVVPRLMILWDEIQTARSSTSQNGEMLTACHDQKIRGIGLSATAVNSPLHFKSLGKCLGLKGSDNWFRFQLDHGVSKQKFGFQWWCGMNWADLYLFSHYNTEKKAVFKKRSDGWEELGRRQAAVMQGLHLEIFGTGKGVRLRKTDIPGFPMATIIPYLVDFKEATPKIRDAYNQMKIRLAGEEGRKHRMAILTETQMTVELLKLEGMKPDIESALEEGNSVVVFLNYNKSVDLVGEMFQTQCVVRGGQTQTARQHWVDSFQRNDERLMVANNMAGSDTIGLHDLIGGFPRVSFVCPTPWAELMRQASGRTQRNGAKSPSVIYFPYALGTQEEKVMALAVDKFARIDAFNDGSILAALTD